ncbi:putative porin [Paraburkholderia caballeronis]|uniref:porin n=1 Tax=Paraburkholderia caballeronis TaxID=416943 RepID=UPI001066EAD6|nr:porin [Paraburkholderia caballeronis]TDV33629.1 putative porin [Paraburkholderia caballeronis]
MRKMVWMAAGALVSANVAHAQSSVTLYGIVDNGIGYQSSATTLGSTTGGRSLVKMTTGVFAADRIGLKGAEDLGGQTQAIFTLEQGFNAANGAEAASGLMFSRLAYVGLTNPTYGTLSAGRVYSAYYTLLQPFSPEPRLTGYYAAHPGDIDGTDTDFHENNTILYTSPNYHGLTVSGEYSFGGVAGSLNAGSAWSAGVQYLSGPIGIAAAFWRINNSTPGGGPWGASSATSNNGTQIGVSAINVGYQTAQAQQRFAVGGGYTFNSAWDVSLMYSNTQYIPGTHSAFTDTAIFNTIGGVLHFKPTPALDLAAGYAYTRATSANQISSPAQYHQFNLSQVYSLSKTTALYAVEGFQRASGQTLGINGGGDIVDAVASTGDGANAQPASSRSQFVGGIGLMHKF